MNTIVRCPVTGRACSEGACRERHWCRQLFERGLSHTPVAQRAAYEAQISTKVLRQDSSRSPVHFDPAMLGVVRFRITPHDAHTTVFVAKLADGTPVATRALKA